LFYNEGKHIVKLAQEERVQNFDDLSDRAKVNFQITMERNDPMSFITNRRNTGGNQVPITFGTQILLAYIKIQHIYSKVSIPMVVKLNFIDKDG
jgi:hypothetical protein